METRVIYNKKDKDIMLEGTEELLLDITPEDKFFILALASDLNVNEFGDSINLKVFKNHVGRYKMATNKALKCLIIVLAHYYYNLPKGFKRIKDSTDMVNEDGIVLRFNRKPLTYYINNKGYVKGVIYKSSVKKRINRTIHRVVAETFIPNPENKPQVNHIDCDKTNNKKSNLEWNTQEENMRHAKDNGLRDTPAMRTVGKGEKNSQALITREDVIKIRKIVPIELHRAKGYLAKLFNIDMSLLEDVLIFKNEIKVPKKFIESKRLNSKSLTYFSYKKRYCKDEETFIRGYYLKVRNKLVKNLSKSYQVSIATINDIIARRSWDYNDC